LGKAPIKFLNPSFLFKLVLVCLAISLVIYFGTLSLFVRPASDDFWIYYEFKKHGFLGFFEYYPYNLRLTSLSIFGLMASFSYSFEHFEQLITYYFVLLFSAMYFAVYRFLKTLFNRFNILLHQTKIHILSILLFYALYFGTSNAIEVWFWFIGSSVYLAATLFFILSITELIKIGTANYKPYKVYLFFLVFSGTSENFALATFTVLILLCLKFNYLRKPLFPIIMLLLILPLLNIARNGYYNRHLESSRHYQLSSFKIFYPEETNFDFSAKQLFLPLILFLLFYVAQTVKRQKIIDSISLFYYKNRSFLIFIIFAYLITSFLPLLIVFRSLGPSRAWMAGNVLTISTLFILLFIIWNQRRIINNTYTTKALFIGCFLILFVLLNVYSFQQISRAKTYASAFDTLVVNVKKVKHLDRNYLLSKPLPDSGVISYSSFSKLASKDTSLTSYYFCKVLNRNSLIVLP
jgi:hypothetical protein